MPEYPNGETHPADAIGLTCSSPGWRPARPKTTNANKQASTKASSSAVKAGGRVGGYGPAFRHGGRASLAHGVPLTTDGHSAKQEALDCHRRCRGPGPACGVVRGRAESGAEALRPLHLNRFATRGRDGKPGLAVCVNQWCRAS